MSTKAGMIMQRGNAMAPPKPPTLGTAMPTTIKGGASLNGPMPPSTSQLRSTPFSGNRGLTGAPHQPMMGATFRSIGTAGGDTLMISNGGSFFPGINGIR